MTFVLTDTPAVIAQRVSEQRLAALEAEAWSQRLDEQVSASRLTPQDKARVWAYIKAKRPDLVAFFADAEVMRLIKQCGAVPRFDSQLIKEALRASA